MRVIYWLCNYDLVFSQLWSSMEFIELVLFIEISEFK